MVGIKEIKNKIKSVRSTQKITRAMEMVAASKMKRSQVKMLNTRPYVYNMKVVVKNAVTGSLEYQHRFIRNSSKGSSGYIVVSTDRGLCGGLNINLFKSVVEHMLKYKNKENINDFVSVVGKKGLNFFGRVNFVNVYSSAINLTATPELGELLGVIRSMVDLYVRGEVSKVYLAYNSFVNTMTQKPYLYQLLPIINDAAKEKVNKKLWDYLYEPSSVELLDLLFNRYVESLVYQGVIENQACEQAARMVAMKNASENANEVVERFTLIYNKERQAAITQELSEIVSGAAAV